MHHMYEASLPAFTFTLAIVISSNYKKADLPTKGIGPPNIVARVLVLGGEPFRRATLASHSGLLLVDIAEHAPRYPCRAWFSPRSHPATRLQATCRETPRLSLSLSRYRHWASGRGQPMPLSPCSCYQPGDPYGSRQAERAEQPCPGSCRSSRKCLPAFDAEQSPTPRR